MIAKPGQNKIRQVKSPKRKIRVSSIGKDISATNVTDKNTKLAVIKCMQRT